MQKEKHENYNKQENPKIFLIREKIIKNPKKLRKLCGHENICLMQN